MFLLKMITQESGYTAIKNAYFPAANGLPLMVTSVEKEILVHSSAPALHGEAVLEPNPITLKPYQATSVPHIFPSRPFTPGAFQEMSISVAPTSRLVLHL